MPRVLLNEGRVVGYSAYEEYVKQLLAEDPDAEPASERTWLSSMLAMGVSMLLKVEPTSKEVRDYPLPEGTSIVAANNISASLFLADPADFSDDTIDEHGWCRQVGSYGDLILNDEDHPDDTALTYDYDIDSMTDEQIVRMLNYIKIQDGLVLQPGEWSKREADNNPAKILTYPTLSEVPIVRLRFASPITEPFLLLLTGFSDEGVLLGTTGLDGGAADTYHYVNGDFLGPELFPWASKIAFNVPSAITYQLKNSLVAGTKNVRIDTDDDDIHTTISVDNEITTSERSEGYLTITQENDGGQTQIDIDSGKLVKDGIEAGTGIYLTDTTDSSGEQRLNIRTNLSSKNGSGITIGSSSTTYQSQDISTNLGSGTGIKITDASGSTLKTISTNIVGGAGIITSTGSDGSLIITNNETAGKYTELTKYSNGGYSIDSSDSDEFRIHWYNGFYASTSVHRNANTYDRSWWSDTSNNRRTIHVLVSPSYSGDDLVAASVRLESGSVNSTNQYIHNVRNLGSTDNFVFRHTTSYDDTDDEGRDCSLSKLFYIYFPANSPYSKLRNSNVTFYNTSDELTGIWNLSSSPSSVSNIGASWPAHCTVSKDTTVSGHEGYTCYVVSAVSYADGYNSQLTHYNSSLYAYSLLNLSLSFSVVIN